MDVDLKTVSSLYILLWNSGLFFAIALIAVVIYVYRAITSRKLDSFPLYFVYLLVVLWLSNPVVTEHGDLPRIINYTSYVSNVLREAVHKYYGIEIVEPFMNVTTAQYVNESRIVSQKIVGELLDFKNECYDPIAVYRIRSGLPAGLGILDKRLYGAPFVKGCASKADAIVSELSNEIKSNQVHAVVLSRFNKVKQEKDVDSKYIKKLADQECELRVVDFELTFMSDGLMLSLEFRKKVIIGMYFCLFFVAIYAFIPYKILPSILLFIIIVIVELFSVFYSLVDIGEKRLISFLDGQRFSQYDTYSSILTVNVIWIIICILFVIVKLCKNRAV
ncbi:MAG: hypothetical protein HY606_00210 [Planctomycetes bacterium]|nr:hypothetical protein [Planctomycetota bacterium]